MGLYVYLPSLHIIPTLFEYFLVLVCYLYILLHFYFLVFYFLMLISLTLIPKSVSNNILLLLFQVHTDVQLNIKTPYCYNSTRKQQSQGWFQKITRVAIDMILGQSSSNQLKYVSCIVLVPVSVCEQLQLLCIDLYTTYCTKHEDSRQSTVNNKL